MDEFHHAAADSYLNVLEYFEPEFLLGLTATPYRMDNKDIFELCSNNKIYEIDLRTAINRDLLVPFEYFGIYDQEVDYDQISYQNGKYNGKELEEELYTHKRADLIYNNYRKRAGKRTLGFCASIEHAKYMTEYFNQQAEEFEYPEGCRVNFDFKLLDLFAEMKKNDPLEERMKNEYFRLKSELNKRPMRLDLYQGSDLEIKKFLNSRYYEKGYLRFLAEIEELNKTEMSWLNTFAEEFLVELESTRMNKLYKIPVLKALIKNGKLRMKVPIEEVGLSFMNFYNDNPRMQKDLDGKRHQGWQQWDQQRFIKEAEKNPIKYLSKRKFFNYDEVNKDFYLNQKLEKFIGQDLSEHFKDIVELRKLKYYNRRLK